MGKKIIIIGGVAGGASAAARLRRLSEKNEIVLFERGEYISFANCGLPYYIGGTIADRKKLLLQTVEGFSKRFKVDVRNLSEVVSINREEKTVTVKNVTTNEQYEEAYDELILSPGAKPIRPNIPGLSDADNVFTLRNIPDTDAIKTYVTENKLTHAVVIGGGFIGVEMAENLWDLGVKVTLIEAGNQIMAPVDFEMASILHDHIRSKGVELILEDGVASFENNGRQITLNSGRKIPSDVTIMSIGVAPENTLAKDARLETGLRGAIKVNEQLRTNDEHIYAIGDAIEVKDYINGQETVIPLAWPANRQGRLVGDIIMGKGGSYNGTLGTSIAKVFDLTVAATGNNEKTLKRLGLKYEVVHIHPNSHAGYYPGAFPVALKLVFNPETGVIYGAQAVGVDGIDKRMDVIATAIKGKLSVLDLPDLELAYAPPYSSAKDPVNMAGYVATAIMDGMVEVVHWHEINEIIEKGGTLIDVRDAIEREAGFVPGSINIPLNDLRERLQELPKDETLYVSCQVGFRGYLAARILMENGYKVKNLSGGYKTYKAVYPFQPTVNVEETKPSEKKEELSQPTKSIKVDACGLQCPGPLLRVTEAVKEANDGDTIEVTATDFGFASDIEAWCKRTGHTLLSTNVDKTGIHAIIQKGGNKENPVDIPQGTKEGATLVVFSGDYDKTVASFIIANGAAAMGKQVTMFFTFWGLNVLKKDHPGSVEKDGLDKMFSMMLPKGPNQLPLSKMNMGGIGTKMIQHVMEKKNVASLQELLQTAQSLGVKLVACTMSMDVMGISKEELIEGLDYAGVATYLSDAEESNLNLFI